MNKQKEKSTIVEGVPSQENTGITNKGNRVEEQKGKDHSTTSVLVQEVPKPESEKGEKKWANLFTSNKMAARGIDLVFIPPTIQDGISKVQLQQEEMEHENEKWQKVVILYIIGDSPSIGALERFIASQWNFAAKPKIYYHNEGYFIILFNNMEGKNEVLYSGPHTIGTKPLILKSWPADFNLYNEVLKTIPLCANFPNLPLNY